MTATGWPEPAASSDVSRPRLAQVVTRAASIVALADMAVVAASGVYLIFNYRPTTSEPVSCGQVSCPRSVPLLIRHVHRWSAYSLIGVTIICLVGAAVAHRGATSRLWKHWASPSLAVVSAGVAALSGWFLPWDQLAVWAVTPGQGGRLLNGYRFLWHPELVRFLLVGGREESPQLARWIFAGHIGLALVTGGCLVIVTWQSFRHDRTSSLTARALDPRTARRGPTD